MHFYQRPQPQSMRYLFLSFVWRLKAVLQRRLENPAPLFSQQAADNSSAHFPPFCAFSPNLLPLPSSPSSPLLSSLSQPHVLPRPSLLTVSHAETLPPSPQLPYFTPGRGTVTVFPSLSDSLLSPPAAPPYSRCVNQLYGPAGTHYQCRTARTGQYCHQVFPKWQ